MMIMFLVVMMAVNSVVSVTPVSTNMNVNVSPSVTSSAAGNTVTKSEAVKPGTYNICLSHCLAHHSCVFLVFIAITQFAH